MIAWVLILVKCIIAQAPLLGRVFGHLLWVENYFRLFALEYEATLVCSN